MGEGTEIRTIISLFYQLILIVALLGILIRIRPIDRDILPSESHNLRPYYLYHSYHYLHSSYDSCTII